MHEIVKYWYFRKNDCPSFVSVSEEEFLVLAENLRPWTQQAMKIEVAPWIRDYVVEMQELYCDLILEEIACKPSGMKRTIVENYQVLFDLYTTVPNKILAKGDPGMGKTTWGKKIAFDWAKKKFNKLSIVLFVYLKFVHPNDSLENAMIKQIPEIEGLHVSASKLESFIEHFGERCLLILDGLDEHAVGSNKDVRKVLQHRKYLNCNVLLTSRPHSISQIKHNFHTIISVEGFTRGEARKFASCIVPDAKVVEQIIDYNPTGGKQEILLCQCPVLLSFMCILVREKAVNLTDKTMPTGEIYTRMIQCLYKKFTIRKEIRYDDGELTRVLGLVGKLAWETLLSGNPLFERSRVEREVGEDAFDYGFLIGNEDLIGDLKADILITFAHRSIQEFFGAYGFVSLLNNRENRLLDLDDRESKEDIVLMNPLFLHFCFWFLSGRCNREYFPHVDMKTACIELYTCVPKRIQRRVLNLRHIVQEYPAVNVLRSLHSNDNVDTEHFGRILEMFDNVQCVTLRYDDPIDWILTHIKSTLTLIVVEDDSEESQDNLFPEFLQSKGKNLKIVLFGKACTPGVLKGLLERVEQWERPPIVYLFLLTGKCVDLSGILHQGMHELHVNGTSRAQTKVIASSDLISCPFLTHLSITGHVALDESVMLAIGKAVREGKLSSMKSLNLESTELTGRIVDLFHADKILSTVTNLCLYSIDKNDINVISQYCTKVTILSLNTLPSSGFRAITKSIRRGMLTNLRKLCLSMIENETIDLEGVTSKNLPQLEHLGLQRCIDSNEVLKQLSHLVTQWALHTLDISHSRGIKGKLSILLQYEFPSLKSLMLHDCELKKKDLNSLDQANARGRLPILEDLDLSENYRLIGNVDMMSSKWIHLKRLKLDHQPNPHLEQTGLDILEKLTIMDCFPSMQTLRLGTGSTPLTRKNTVQMFEKLKPQFKYLERLDIVAWTDTDIVQFLACIRNSKIQGYFWDLQRLCVLTDKVSRHVVHGKVINFFRDFRELGVELYLIKPDLEKLAIGSDKQ